MTEYRNAHPYFMYEAIEQQPERVARVLERQCEAIDRAAARAAAQRRIIFLGIGTSYHAALLGELFLRHLTGGRAEARVDTSFQFLHYPIAVGAHDAVVVISHRSNKSFSMQALERARASGALTILLTGEGSRVGEADHVIPTCELETAFAHTKSYTTAVAALARFAIGVAALRGQASDAAASRAALHGIPERMRQALGSDAACREAAKYISQRHQFIFLGAGPNWVTAMEAVIKVLETSYVPSSGHESEQFLHGPFCQVDARAAAIAIVAGGAADVRMHSVLAACGALGVARVVVAMAGAGLDVEAEQRVEVPAAEKWLSPLVLVVPLQLISYYVALDRGTNPDSGRQQEADHAKAQKMFAL